MLFKKDNTEENYYLAQAVSGDRAALEYLVKTYQSMAYTIAIKIVVNNNDAEEVVQDSFIKAFRHLGDFRKASKFSTWLYQIVYHTALNRLRLKTTHTEILDDRSEIVADNGEHDILHKLSDADRSRYLTMALGQLKAEDRVIITLHYISERSIKEIAEISGLKHSAVKMRLMRARKQLETILMKLLNDEIKEL